MIQKKMNNNVYKTSAMKKKHRLCVSTTFIKYNLLSVLYNIVILANVPSSSYASKCL